MSKLNILLLVFLFHLASISLYAQENKTKIVIANERESSTFHHTVEKGETVYAIATMYGVKPEDIYRLNPGSKEGIRAGATLQIPQRTASQKEEHYIFHTIQPKETLYAVSKRYAVPATAIVNANPGLSTSTFQIGKTIRIPTFVKDEGEEESHQKEVSTEAEEIEYTIEKRETLYRICRKFDISSYELLKRNPQLKEGVKAGMKIKIPVLTQKEKPQPKQPKQTAPLNERETNALLAQKPKSEPVQRIKVALLLPFMTNETEPSAETKRFIEYYEGMLLAVDSLRSQGFSLDLSVYDTGDGTKRIREILTGETLPNVDLIIGAVQNDQIKLVADFAKEHNIKYVIPFTSKNDDVLSNACVFQVNTPHSYLYSKAAERGRKLFAKDNIIFVNVPDKGEKTEFIKAFKTELKDHDIPFKEMDYDVELFAEEIDSLYMVDSCRNVVIPTSSSIEALQKVKTPLRMLAETQTDYTIALFGYPEWQTYVREALDDFYVLDTYIYTNFYADNLGQPMHDFYDKFKTWYSKDLINTYPKYGILGFDTGMFFFGAMKKYGANFEDKLDEFRYPSIQTGFDFHRVNNWGGFINTNIFIVHYHRDYTVTRD